MAFYKSKYTGTEIDQRLTQGTYDDAVKAGFTGSKEEFDKIIVAFDENAQQKLDAAQPKIDHRLETLNKSIVDAINELHDEVNQKQDIGDYVDKGEFEVFKDEVAATYATKGQVSEETDRAKEAEEKLSDSITTVNSNLVNSINILNKNVSDSLKVVNEAIQQSAETLVAEIEQRKEADSQLETQHKKDIETIKSESESQYSQLEESLKQETADRQAEDAKLDSLIKAEAEDRTEADANLQTSISQEVTAREALAERVSTLENADYQTENDVTAKINEVVDNAPEELNTLKKIADSLNNDSDFAATMTTELSKKLDSDKLLAGAGIDVREEDGKKIVDISEETLTKIQYADSEVRRLEKDKISYAYDEKTQSNINVILPEGGSYLGNYGNENATVAKAAVYDGTKQLELGSSKVHTNINTDSDVTIETSTGKKTIATTDELVNVVNIPIRSLQDKVYTQEEVFDWFGVTSVPELKQKISRGSQMYLRYGISLSGNPMYYKMPIEYTAFESANQIKLVFVGLNTRDDVASKYEILINLDGTIIEGNSNVKMTITSIESGNINLSDPYEINLNNLLSAENSESISTAIGGIDNLNATVQDNRIIIGTISNGNVSVSIRILGNVTTLYYLLDSVVGLTLNEVAITNTSGTLSKSITTHSVLTENMVINSLESDEATLPLSAAQGKILATDKQNKTDNNLSTTNKTIVGAINELLAKVQALETKNTELESRLAA